MKRLLLTAVLASACATEPSALQGKGYSLSGRNPFRLEVDRQLLREWGGAGSAKFNQVLEEELERANLCRNGYVLRQHRVHDDVVTISGRCGS